MPGDVQTLKMEGREGLKQQIEETSTKLKMLPLVF
jgi:uncharacterized protein YfkK (UPF0435 family)